MFSDENIFFRPQALKNFAITASCNVDQYSGSLYKGPKSNYFEQFTRSTKSKSNHWKTIESRKKKKVKKKKKRKKKVVEKKKITPPLYSTFSVSILRVAGLFYNTW